MRLVLASLLATLLSWSASTAAEPALLQVLTSAQFIKSDATKPPPDSAPWSAQTLPDNWLFSRPWAKGFAWYRMQFELPLQPDQPYAAYVPFFRNDGEVFVNGTFVGRTDSSELPINGPPQFVTIPPSLLHAGLNALHLRLYVVPNGVGAVSAVSVGDARQLRQQFERDYFFRITGSELCGVLSAALGLFTLSLWMRRPKDTMYAYFGVAALLWAVSTVYDFVSHPPIPAFHFITAIFALDHVIPVVWFVFALRYAGWCWPRTERWLWIYSAASVAIIIVENLRSDGGSHVWRFTYYPIIFGYLIVLAIAAQRRPFVERMLLTLAVLFQGITVVYDLVAEQSPSDLGIDLWWSYRALFLYVAIGWTLVDRFVLSLNAYEALNAELEQRVGDKHMELERNYLRIQQMEQERAIVGERKRIMSDMHDGVGGQLISTLSLVEQGQATSATIAAALRECIDDLRLTIDSLEPTENDLLPVLGNLRYRLDPRLRAQGIDVDWQVNEVPKLSCLTPQNVLHVLRILQEGFTNVLKHAHAHVVRLATGVDPSGRNVYIRLQDDGAGFAGNRIGYGLRNMRDRAKMIGGDLDIQSSPTGTTLNLLLPVD